MCLRTFMTGGTHAGTKPRSSPHTIMSEAACSAGSLARAEARHTSSWRLGGGRECVGHC